MHPVNIACKKDKGKIQIIFNIFHFDLLLRAIEILANASHIFVLVSPMHTRDSL